MSPESLTSLVSTLKGGWSDIGWSGFADIALLSALLYLGMSWLRGIRRVLQGVVVLVAVYLAARLFQLGLTATALEVLFVVVVIAAIVSYRDEVRHAIERLALFYRGKRASRAPTEVALSHTVFSLAEQRTGALIAIEGRDRLDDVVGGGTALDALVSDPLLKSLFDTHSPGHDGAVLIRDGRISHFACHLPLSSNYAELGGRGTRHAAGLGLSERSDALCIIVSEERGTVSVASDGKLVPAADPDDLDRHIAEHRRRHGPRQTVTRTPRIRLPIAASAVLMSGLLWTVLVYGARPAQRTFEIAVKSADLPAGLQLATLSPNRVRVTLTGARHDFFFVDARNVQATVPLGGATEGRFTYNFDATDISAPAALNVKSITPSQVVALIAKRP